MTFFRSYVSKMGVTKDCAYTSPPRSTTFRARPAPRWPLAAIILLSSLPRLATAEPVFISPTQAAKWIVRTEATVLDARGKQAKPPYLPRARTIDWMSLRDGYFRTGTLDADLDDLREALQAVGVSGDRPVLVYGAMRAGWGEEGRIWWMLRYLGHARVRILDGGIQGWQRERLPTRRRPRRARIKGAFRPRRLAYLRADWKKVDRQRRQAHARVLDTRTRAEFDGKTPFWSKRGGHVPGAVHLYWKSLLGRNGRVLPIKQVTKRLRQLGIGPKTPVSAYCTGGVRSAFVVAVLVHAGFSDAANYDGSWWDWSARSQLPVE